MTRAALEHLLRAAAAVTNELDIVVVGSQAVLGQFPEAPTQLLVSIEADLFPRDAPQKSDLIDGAIGELSMFHQEFGYYAHGVDETTAIVPAGWRDRLVRIHNDNTGGATGWCLDVHDLAASKIAAWREKDIDFVRALVRSRMVNVACLRERIRTLTLPPGAQVSMESRLDRVLGLQSEAPDSTGQGRR